MIITHFVNGLPKHGLKFQCNTLIENADNANDHLISVRSGLSAEDYAQPIEVELSASFFPVDLFGLITTSRPNRNTIVDTISGSISAELGDSHPAIRSVDWNGNQADMNNWR